MKTYPAPDILSIYEDLDHFLTMSAVAIDQCERRVVKGEKVPAPEKIVSIFDDHTDIIKWGKSLSPTEFCHKGIDYHGKEWTHHPIPGLSRQPR